MHQLAVALCVAFCVTLPARAAEPSSAPAPATPGSAPDDLDALSLADKAPTAAAETARKWRFYLEGAGGQGRLRGSDGRFDTSRVSLDARFDGSLAPGLRGVLSDRLDLIHSNGVPRGDDVNTLREAYLSWSPADDQIIDFGRVNVRHGTALGYNPTDWFKEGALRAIVSPAPAMLRENRQGTFVVQGQKLWEAASLTATFSPKLGNAPTSASYALDVGATNPRNRWLLVGSYKVSDKFNPELLLYGGEGTPTQFGFNASSLIGDATVAFAEFSVGRGRSLVARALNLAEAERTQRRAALGSTYTTAFNLSFTAEAEYSSAGPDSAQWHSLSAIDAAAPLRVLSAAQTLQDLQVRRAWFFYATWKDLLLRRLDVTGYLRRDAETGSRARWLEARYRWDSVELLAQWVLNSGAPGSVFQIIPQSRTFEVALRVDF